MITSITTATKSSTFYIILLGMLATFGARRWGTKRERQTGAAAEREKGRKEEGMELLNEGQCLEEWSEEEKGAAWLTGGGAHLGRCMCE